MISIFTTELRKRCVARELSLLHLLQRVAIPMYISTGPELRCSFGHSIVMPPPLGAGGIMFSVCPSVRPSEAWNDIFWPVHGSVGPSDQPWPFCGMPVRPSVRPERFLGICRRTHEWNGLKFCVLMYLGHLRNWLGYGHGLLIFLLLASLWLSEMGQIWWCFRAFPREGMVGMA